MDKFLRDSLLFMADHRERIPFAEKHNRDCFDRSKLLRHIGEWDRYATCEQNPQRIFFEQRKDLGDLEIVEIQTCLDLKMPVYLLHPSQKKGAEKLPVTVLWHGHNHTSRSMTASQEDPSLYDQQDEEGMQLAIRLCQQGFLVVVPEIMGFGSRRLQDHAKEGKEEKNSCYRLGSFLLMAGKTIAGLRAHEVLAVVDYLCTRDDVDPLRIGMMGHSGGALIAMLASLLDERVKVTILANYASTFEASILSVSHCLCNYIPGLSAVAEMADLLQWIAPRDLVLLAGRNDQLFPVDAAQQCMNQVRQFYEQKGALTSLATAITDSDHQLQSEPILRFFGERL